MNVIKSKTGIIVIMIAAAALSRLIPHPVNFTPIGAIALFGAWLDRKAFAFIIPLLAIWGSNLLIDNVLYNSESFVWISADFPFQVLGFTLIALMANFTLKKVNFGNVLGSAVASSVIFFLVSNAGTLFTHHMYPQTFTGLMEAYVAGLPYYGNSLLGDLSYSLILFGGFELYRRRTFTTGKVEVIAERV